MTDLHDEIVAIVYKHLPGKHSQKRHGWRYGGGVDSARRSMRGEKDPEERAEYRRRAGMSEPKKMERKPEEVNSPLKSAIHENRRQIDELIDHRVNVKILRPKLVDARQNDRNEEADRFSSEIQQRKNRIERIEFELRGKTERQLKKLGINGDFWEEIFRIQKEEEAKWIK